jgi:hypothetical protein
MLRGKGRRAMRWNGHNILAIIFAALVMFGIGAGLYGYLLKDAWMQAMGLTTEPEMETWRYALWPAMPLLQAIGLSLVIKWRSAVGWMSGAATGFWMALFFVFASRLYGFVYSEEVPTLLGIDALHLFLINMVGGAIIGAWK